MNKQDLDYIKKDYDAKSVEWLRDEDEVVITYKNGLIVLYSVEGAQMLADRLKGEDNGRG